MSASFRILLILLCWGGVPFAHADSTEPSVPADALTRGFLLQQGDTLVFAPCRERIFAFLEDVSPGQEITKALGSLEQEAGKKENGKTESGKKIYAEFIGHLAGDRLKVSRLNFARTEGRCQVPGGAEEVWRGAGTLTPWTMGLGSEGVHLRQGEEKLNFPPLVLEQHGESFSGQVQQGERRFSLNLDPGFCRDGDYVFGWKAKVVLDGKPLEGCAWQR